MKRLFEKRPSFVGVVDFILILKQIDILISFLKFGKHFVSIFSEGSQKYKAGQL